MRFWIDTEFVEAPMEDDEVDWSRASAWVDENVRPFLGGRAKQQAAAELIEYMLRGQPAYEGSCPVDARPDSRGAEQTE